MHILQQKAQEKDKRNYERRMQELHSRFSINRKYIRQVTLNFTIRDIVYYNVTKYSNYTVKG